MRRGFWFAAGAATGVYAVARARRVAEAFTADGVRDRVGAAFLGARMFRDEVAQGAAEAESGLRARFGADGQHALPPGGTGATTPGALGEDGAFRPDDDEEGTP